jgi:alpha-tubulin suppressor-like RCC1 family protein
MRAAWLAVALTIAGCADVAPFVCTDDTGCAPGRCEASGACSFTDDSCGVGWRYGAAGPSDRADLCVGEEAGAIAQLGAGSEHTCARGVDGRTWCWGNDLHGALGRLGPSTEAPIALTLPAISDLDGAEWTECAVAGGQVWCWGEGTSGELGRGTTIDDATPAPIPGLADVVDVDLGEKHGCAVDAAGAVWCWGRNADAEAGDAAAADTAPILAPIRVATPPARALTAGGQNTCVLTVAGEAWCWGRNNNGQLGREDADRAAPAPTPGFAGAAQLAIGGDHICARFDDGHVACAGMDAHGQLGNGPASAKEVHLPGPVDGITDAVELVALDWANCVRRRDGEVVCWGEGDRGELGSGVVDRPSPGAPVPLPAPAVALTAGEHHACALTTDGCVWCWGSDSAGQLGDGPGLGTGVRPALLGACTRAP